jgi:hypothetical protein
MRAAAALLVALAVAGTVIAGSAVLAEAWLTAFLAWLGLSVGALGALATGHLLREDWLAPVRQPLEAAARTLPLMVLMAVPVLALLEALYPWAGPLSPPMPAPRDAWLSPLPFRLRGVLLLALWAALAWLLTRPGPTNKPRAALVLLLLAATVPVAAQDWSLSRDAAWWGSLQGFTVWVEGVMAALAAAALISLARGEMPAGETGAGEALERALLALGLTTLWLWFTQFIVVWMADLPAEAGWYLRRMEEPWLLLKFGVAVPALLLALLLAAPPRHRAWRMCAVCMLLLASHVAHLWWVVRPDAPVAFPPLWLDLAAIALLGTAWVLWWRAEMRGRPAFNPPASEGGPNPATASAH